MGKQWKARCIFENRKISDSPNTVACLGAWEPLAGTLTCKLVRRASVLGVVLNRLQITPVLECGRKRSPTAAQVQFIRPEQSQFWRRNEVHVGDRLMWLGRSKHFPDGKSCFFWQVPSLILMVCARVSFCSARPKHFVPSIILFLQRRLGMPSQSVDLHGRSKVVWRQASNRM